MTGPQWRVFALVVILVAFEIGLSPASRAVVKSIATDPLHPDLTDTAALTRAGAYAAGGLALIAVAGFAPGAATAFVGLLYVSVLINHGDQVLSLAQGLSAILNGGGGK